VGEVEKEAEGRGGKRDCRERGGERWEQRFNGNFDYANL